MPPISRGLSLITAARKGDLAGVLAGLPSATTSDKGLALHSAVSNGHHYIAECLLEAGCGQTDKDVSLPAAVNSHSAALVQLLLDAGADVHSFENEALRTAARRGNLEIATLLLNAGADVHAREDEALLWASYYGHTGLAQCLLAAGADIHAHGAAALSTAAEAGHVAVAHFLLTAGKYSQVELGKALRKAADGQFPEIVILLRLHGASLAHLAPKLDQYPDEVQLVAVATGSLARIRVERYAKLLCLDALHVLLERKGHADLSAMLKATQLLEPLTPAERAEMLSDLLKRHKPQVTHVPA